MSSKGVQTFALSCTYDLGYERVRDGAENLIPDRTGSVYQTFYSHLQKYLTEGKKTIWGGGGGIIPRK